MNKYTAFSVIVAAIAMALVILFTSGIESVAYLAVFSFASAPLAAFFIKGYTDLRSMADLKISSEEAADALSALCYYRQKGKSILSTIGKVERISTNAKITSTLHQARMRIVSGEDPPSALSNAFIKNGIYFSGFHLANGTNIYASVKKYLDEKLSEKLRKNAIKEATLQRYATFNMFLSSVLPSFIIFAFVAESILNGGRNNLLFLSIVMLEVIPTLYFLGNTAFFRRLFE
ncbi:MAG: hypothetical protein QXF41_01635 [Candidatus Micrarchaeaceae archaeon]